MLISSLNLVEFKYLCCERKVPYFSTQCKINTVVSVKCIFLARNYNATYSALGLDSYIATKQANIITPLKPLENSLCF